MGDKYARSISAVIILHKTIYSANYCVIGKSDQKECKNVAFKGKTIVQP